MKHWALLPIIFLTFPVSHGLVTPVPPLHCLVWQFIYCSSSSAWLLIILLIILFTVFPIFHCLLSLLTYFVHGILPAHNMSKIFKFADCGQSFQRVFGHAYFLMCMVSSIFVLCAFFCIHTALLERLLSAVA